MSSNPSGRVERVVILVQENHTTDNYFRGLAPYGGAVAADWPISPNPPAQDPPHDRHAYFEWLTGASTGVHVQFDTRTVLAYYLSLALTGAFLENHCAGFGTNSTANHLLIVGGQSPRSRIHQRASRFRCGTCPRFPAWPTLTPSPGGYTRRRATTRWPSTRN